MRSVTGRKVYRFNDRYFVYCYLPNPYPDGLGLEMIHDIPRNGSKEELEEWVKSTEEYLEAQYKVLKNVKNAADHEVDNLEKYVTDKRPQPETEFEEFLYEIDLDGLIFHVDGQPLFRLDNMPPDDIFVEGISFDHFGHRALYEHTPDQYRYRRRAPPPVPPPQSLIAYNSFPNRSSTTSIHELLRIHTALSPIERARMALVEVLVTACMTKETIGWNLRVQESRANRDEMLPMFELAMLLVRFAVGPQFPQRRFMYSPNVHGNVPDYTQDFIWIRKDVCLRITTHLDDQVNLRASMGDLVHHINMTHDKVGTIYGVAFSILHCAIVRVDKGAQDTSFAHTPALQFLPSFYAKKMSTPGIEALSRLGYQASGAEFLTAIFEHYDITRIRHKNSLVTGSVAAKVPVEVWRNIGDSMSSPLDLVALASISPQAMSAAADLARYPWVRNPWEQPMYYGLEALRLVDVVGTVSPIPETTESTDEEEIRTRYFQLGHRKFTASVEGGRLVNVELGQSSGYERYERIMKPRSDDSSPMTFDARYLSPVAMFWNEGKHNRESLYLWAFGHYKSQ